MNAIQPAAAVRRIFQYIDEGQYDAAIESLGALSPQDTLRELAEAELALYRDQARDTRARFEAVGENLRRAGETFGVVRALSALASIDRAERRTEDALRRLREARDVAAGVGAPDVLASVLIDLGTAQLEAGRPRDAAESAREAIEAARAAGDATLEGAAFVLAASALIDAGSADEAQAVLDEAVLRPGESAGAPTRAALRMLQGRLLTQLDRGQEAVEVLREAAGTAREAGDPRLEAHALTFLLEALEAAAPAAHGSRVERTARALRERPRTPIRRTPSNELVFSGDVLPTWTAAKRTLERFILENALKQTNNNRAAAGRMLKITKVAVHHACKRHGFGGGQ